MGKFISTTYANAVSSLQTGALQRLNNPFTTFMDKSPFETIFYNVSREHTTTDIATGDVYTQYGVESPYRFDRYEGAMLFGVPHIELDLDQGEYGTEASAIEFECYVPPNEFVPIPASYFTINAITIGKPLLFRVTEVNRDTIDNGGNFYKLHVKLDAVGQNYIDSIERQVVNRYKVLASNIGSELECIISDEDYDNIKLIESYCTMLKDYYHDLFFRRKVQTFVYERNDWNRSSFFYDPFLIEFLIREGVLDGDKYEYIGHACVKPPLFEVDYAHTVFSILTKQDTINKGLNKMYAVKVKDPMSLMFVRLEDYYCMTVRDQSRDRITGVLADPIDEFDPAFVDALLHNKKFDRTDPRYYYNLTLDAYRGNPIDKECLETLKEIHMVESKELYYMIPLTIFSLESYIKDKLNTDTERMVPRELKSNNQPRILGMK